MINFVQKWIETPNDIKIGDKLISALGNEGNIVAYDPEWKEHNDDEHLGWFEVDWSSGNKTKNYIWTSDGGYDCIQYIGR